MDDFLKKSFYQGLSLSSFVKFEGEHATVEEHRFFFTIFIKDEKKIQDIQGMLEHALKDFHQTESNQSNKKVRIVFIGQEVLEDTSGTSQKIDKLSKQNHLGFMRKNLSYAKAVVAICSGKGGVGKSTSAVNLALSLKNQGLRVGLMDLDFHGPSLGKMLGLASSKEYELPVEHYGIFVCSLSLLQDEASVVAWKTPMILKAMDQLLTLTTWPCVDILILDTPPGTGDLHMKLGQQYGLSGVVIISTPQDIALMDTFKSVDLFRRLGVPCLGMIENMSYYLCKHCGTKEYIFGQEGVLPRAKKENLTFLGEIPLDIRVRQGADAGYPLVLAYAQDEISLSYQTIAIKIKECLKL